MKFLEIRRAVPGDEAVLASLHTRSWCDAFDTILSSEMAEQGSDFDKIQGMYQSILTHDLANVALALIHGVPCCTASWADNREDLGTETAELICIHSPSEFWGRGLGRNMMQYVLDQVRQAGYSKIVLWVFSENQRAIRLYEKCGFQKTSATRQIWGVEESLFVKGF